VSLSIKSARTLMRNSAKASERFPEVMKEIQSMAKSVKKAGDETASTMHDSHTAIETITHQTVPNATRLIVQLNDVAGNLEQITQQMKRNPSIILKGVELPSPVMGEK